MPDSGNKDVLVGLWFAMSLVAIAAVIGSAIAGEAGGLFAWALALPLVIALLATIAILYGERLLGPAASREKAETSEKAKRQGADKLALLMDLLDEDERAAFKARLMDEVLAEAGSGSDGELPYDADSLEALLGDQESARTRRG